MHQSICNATSKVLEKAKNENVSTIWDRFEQQLPQCGYGLLGICCRICNMGPCRIDPFGNAPQTGVCGATADIIVARNLLAYIATGAAAHSDHGRDVVLYFKTIAEKNGNVLQLSSLKKLYHLAKEFGIVLEGKTDRTICLELSDILLSEFGRQEEGEFALLKRAPRKRVALWRSLNLIPRGIDREIVESMHRTHMGVDNDATSLLLQGVRTAIADGWAGSMIATEVSDILFGVPEPRLTQVNLGVLKNSMVNIIIHGHEPLLADTIVTVASDKRLMEKSFQNGAHGINICGMCCTGNESLLRHGVKLAGNFLQQELAIITGAVDAMVVDLQCIMPSLGDVAKCYHTKFITTSSKAHFPNAMHFDFNESNPEETAYAIIESAIDNYKNRIVSKVAIPTETMGTVAGFSVESLESVFGPGFELLIESIVGGKIKGIAFLVGCNNPKVTHDQGHVVTVKELIKRDVFVISTGCSAIACAKAGLLSFDAADFAGPELKKLCCNVAIPPVIHMGSCVDISRILCFSSKLADALNCDISDLPIAAAAPEWMSQKAVSIGTYLVGSGIFTVLGTVPAVLGSVAVKDLLLDGLEKVIGAKFAVEMDSQNAANLICSHIEKKQSTLMNCSAAELRSIKVKVNEEVIAKLSKKASTGSA